MEKSTERYGQLAVEPESPASAGGAQRPRRRRWVRATVITALVVVLLAVAGTVGIGYYFASVLLTVDNSVEYPLKISAVNGKEITLPRDEDTERPAVLGLVWDGGRAELDSKVTVSGDNVIRFVSGDQIGALKPGLAVDVDTRVYGGDPKSARQLDFETVTLKGELGDLPSWYVPPTGTKASKTWVVAVHGLGASRTETLRALPIIAEAGFPTLAISYRNDAGAAASSDNYYHLGDTEWRDVATAIAYAREHGATGVILYAWSMGGALSMTALRRMPPADAGFIKGLVLDSANFDWNAILEYQASQRGLPGFVTWTAKQFVEARADLELDDFDQRPYAPQLKVPMLVFVDTADMTVPNGPAVDFARARPDLVTLVTTTGGGHTGSWNADPGAYGTAVTGFLAKLR